MRRSVVLLIVLFLAPPAHAATRCDAPQTRGPVGLADTILVKGACGTFALRRDGSVELVHPRPWAPPWALGALARADDRTYIAHPRRHLVLSRDAKVLWRSRLPHGSDNVVVHDQAIAFNAYERPTPDLWVARIGAPERLAGPGEDLQGWARAGGFLTQRGHELRLRAADGRLVRRLALVKWSAYDRETQSVFGISNSNLLIRTDGRQTATLADLGSLGLARTHGWKCCRAAWSASAPVSACFSFGATGRASPPPGLLGRHATASARRSSAACSCCPRSAASCSSSTLGATIRAAPWIVSSCSSVAPASRAFCTSGGRSRSDAATGRTSRCTATASCTGPAGVGPSSRSTRSGDAHRSICGRCCSARPDSGTAAGCVEPPGPRPGTADLRFTPRRLSSARRAEGTGRLPTRRPRRSAPACPSR